MIAVMACLGAFPAAMNLSYLVFMSGLKVCAVPAALISAVSLR